MDESIALVAFSKHSERVRSKPFDYAHIEVGLKIWFPRRCDAGGQVKRFCDVDAPVDAKALETLLEAGIDEALARHVAHLFVRDPLVLFEGMVEELDDAVATDHFDNLQSTNWNTVRLKPPVGLNPEGEPGWRTEFRPMEVQLTDFENAAFSVFTRAGKG